MKIFTVSKNTRHKIHGEKSLASYTLGKGLIDTFYKEFLDAIKETKNKSKQGEKMKLSM